MFLKKTCVKHKKYANFDKKQKNKLYKSSKNVKKINIFLKVSFQVFNGFTQTIYLSQCQSDAHDNETVVQQRMREKRQR